LETVVAVRVLDEISERADQGTLRAHIDRVVSFEGVGDAQRALEAGETLGRVVLKI
ncbi:zinc-binding dehydrogenase, partial [Rhizobium johnstonii]